MKIIYVLLSDNSGEHYFYQADNLKKWIVPSISQCHRLNPENEIIVITDNFSLKDELSFVKFFDINDYIDKDILWFKENYIHLSTNSFNFERNAIIRYMILRSFCVREKVYEFLHLEPDVIVFSDVNKDGDDLKKFNATFLHGKAAGCCFFNNATEVLTDFVQYIINSYTIPQIDPKAFDMVKEEIRYKYNIENGIGAGGVSDMHYWSLYWYLHQDSVLEQMDKNFDGVFYQTTMMDQKKEGEWDTIAEDGIEIKKLEIKNDNCYGIFNNEEVRIKYLHCHGHSKQLISKYCNVK